MKILVTGDAGFICSNFIYYMLEKHPGYKIVCLDALTYAGNLETLEEAMKNPDFKFVKGDITDREVVRGLFAEEKFDIYVQVSRENGKLVIDVVQKGLNKETKEKENIVFDHIINLTWR